MKKFILIVAVILLVGLVSWGVWFLMTSKNNTTPSAGVSLPSISATTQSGTSARVQSIASPQDAAVAQDFLGGIQNADQIALGGTVVISPYALQIWGDTNKGGEALLEYASSNGWTLISLGGGEWNVLALIQEGVPVSIAEQLVAGLTNGPPPAPTGVPITVPTGDTIIIGTQQGSVTTKNFYSAADYLDQDQRAVVIRGTSTYSLVYNVSDSSFVITIGMPFAAGRQAAEVAFLTQLGISQADACKLDVIENVMDSANNPSNGQFFPLSFCKSSTSF